MKKTTIAVIAAGVLPLAAFAQNLAPSVPPVPPVAPAPGVPAVPPVPPVPPVAGEGREGRERAPKVPVTYLGVETSELPSVVADQLGLPKGFGLVVDYVVPDGPAAAAGVQQNDIIKMMNDQILMEPDQLSKLIRSYPEGTTVTLTVLRKGAETKLPAKLGKREVTQRKGHDHGWRGPNMGDLGPNLEKLTEELGQLQFGKVDGDRIRSDVARAQRESSAPNVMRSVWRGMTLVAFSVKRARPAVKPARRT
jgi:membrane-associated protease RseP (regulator of RpoE activity)